MLICDPCSNIYFLCRMSGIWRSLRSSSLAVRLKEFLLYGFSWFFGSPWTYRVSLNSNIDLCLSNLRLTLIASNVLSKVFEYKVSVSTSWDQIKVMIISHLVLLTVLLLLLVDRILISNFPHKNRTKAITSISNFLFRFNLIVDYSFNVITVELL